jgi:protein-tyrosine phosphatase
MCSNVLHLNAERFIPILTLLTEPDTVPVLIHCAAGRDRTGAIVALIQAALGVPEVVIAEDFALSSQLMALGAPRPEVDHLFGNITDIPREDIIRAMATRPETMHAPFARIRAYASTAGLLDGLDVPVS